MDDTEAARIYKLAADQGDALGQVNLGAFYETGRGGRRTRGRAPL
jgi:TPR repeat protein